MNAAAIIILDAMITPPYQGLNPLYRVARAHVAPAVEASVLSLRVAGFVTLVAIASSVLAQSELPEGYWSPSQASAILDSTITVRLDTPLDTLSKDESTALGKLMEAGKILHRLYLDSQHPQSLEALSALETLDEELSSPRETRALLELFRLFKGPVATTLENERESFLPVEEELPGRNVYPDGISRDEFDSYLAENPDARETLLHVRTLVRRASEENLERDLAVLEQYPSLDRLHPELTPELTELQDALPAEALYAVPYAVAYADDILRVYDLLTEASAVLRARDPDFAAYLNHRARDLLANDYEAGDASWIRGSFGRLNAQIGSYETYDDKLYGAKSFFGLSLLLRNSDKSEALDRALADLQTLQDSLPYEGSKRVSSDIPVGIYDVVADFGQARSANTATILPNESHVARKYGRTILMRHNIMSHPRLFDDRKTSFAAAVEEEHGEDLSLEGGFYYTLWHEIGHYLGPDLTADGTELGAALQEYSNLFEEMKADLVSLFLGPALVEAGNYSSADLRAVYADGVRRVLQKIEPRRDQPYQTMQLMQMNFFLDYGVLSFDEDEGRLTIHYDEYHDAVEELLSQVLAIQREGDADAAAELVDRYGYWEEDLHGRIAAQMEEASPYRYRLIYYGALGE